MRLKTRPLSFALNHVGLENVTSLGNHVSSENDQDIFAVFSRFGKVLALSIMLNRHGLQESSKGVMCVAETADVDEGTVTAATSDDDDADMVEASVGPDDQPLDLSVTAASARHQRTAHQLDSFAA